MRAGDGFALKQTKASARLGRLLKRVGYVDPKQAGNTLAFFDRVDKLLVTMDCAGRWRCKTTASLRLNRLLRLERQLFDKNSCERPKQDNLRYSNYPKSDQFSRWMVVSTQVCLAACVLEKAYSAMCTEVERQARAMTADQFYRRFRFLDCASDMRATRMRLGDIMEQRRLEMPSEWRTWAFEILPGDVGVAVL